MKQISNKHDKFFKEMFSYVENARHLIQVNFPPDILQKLDLNSLYLEDKSYIDSKLEEGFSDLVYSCNYGKNKKVKINLLFEHKSKQSDNDEAQILYYIASANMQAKKQQKHREVILPIVFYHGQKPWRKRPYHKLFGETDTVLQKYIPAFNYVLIDLSQFTDEQIDALYLQKDILRTAILLFKYIQNTRETILKIEKIFNFAETFSENQESENQLKTIFIYLFNNLNKEEAMKTIEKLNKTNIRKTKGFVSYADTLLQEGRQEGRQEGKEEGRQEGATIKAIDDVIKMDKLKFQIEIITDLSGFNETQVNEIRSLVKQHPTITPEEIYKLMFVK